ncbi:MAG: rod shape-determining protein MreC [Flammeovirgaceae bacterium]|nr:rod shape-determining protein MreC [Flammeovirgaceae bacterium]
MERLLYFFFQYRAFFTFLLLEILAGWMIIQNNQYQSVKYFNTSNQIAANLVSISQGVRDYFWLKKVNEDLAAENTFLRTELERQNRILQGGDSVDQKAIDQFDFVHAKVINNSVSRFKNYITINQGLRSGIEPGMAVISTKGVVGKVKSVSEHYAVLISLLNVDEYISSAVKRTNNFGTIHWNGTDPEYADLLYIPRHVKLAIQDSVVTSGYNAIFPPDILVGIVEEVSLREDAPFFEIKVKLAQDFHRLAYVKVIRSKLKPEVDSLEFATIGEPK